ncbi:uncharacterized protein TEOVI_000813700 [Trypanosoma equiperdum]|uniref:Tetratricopeptide repeat protein n=3 Tax=Trypanozoon TaxID=39700 RepID=D0A4A9_TRYB9|nr:hypothetical protein, conserved [Trypanosoma brucei gambiense DAL972]RHW69549.1 hypothetical protein DPX39_100105300 [Trypanosoma brucei equiperdum]CBH16103.1 hypothetical protein, conserved [Trypanosoma brucei gambiense DAL972]SCU67145.1 hypothetical protein, conserved [Trypanosoma equiperdum]|eukprot:XP_011778367.1 hypothetical protein, conserved [Trypanosoma brucei gambiense DAL972]
MGSSSSSANDSSSANMDAASGKGIINSPPPGESPDDNSETTAKCSNASDLNSYREFRDQLLSFSLGESAYDYAETLFAKNPSSPEVMALLAETTVLYDKTKNKYARDHWCDRLDLLQRGVDVSRKCINENPEYGPCYRTYVLSATREAEALYYMKSLMGLGLLENYNAIMRRGEKGMELLPTDADIPNALGALSARCAYVWYNPTRLYARWCGVPGWKELWAKSVQLHKRAVENDPANLEFACRLAQAYFHSGDYQNARRWYGKVRDEMPPQDLKDERWQAIAHTHLSTAFVKTSWNVPFA